MAGNSNIGQLVALKPTPASAFNTFAAGELPLINYDILEGIMVENETDVSRFGPNAAYSDGDSMTMAFYAH